MGNTNGRRVVITGLGLVTPLGIGIETNWNALIEGQSGIGPITKFDASGFATQFAGEVNDFKPEDFIPKKQLKNMDPFLQFVLAAAKMASEDSSIKIDNELSTRAGVIIGCGLGGIYTFEESHKILLNRGPRRISPFFVPMIIGNMAPGLVSIQQNAKGPNLSIQTACAAGTHAIGLAFHMIRDGLIDVAFTGGVEAAVSPICLAGFNAMRALSTKNDAPEKASRPFDKNRDGFVLAEGSGIMVLETAERALERGAKIYAEICGFGLSGDAYHMTAPAPDGEGAVRCMKMAIDDANITPQEVDYINAHGTSTDLNDKFETIAIKTVFGEHAYKLAVSSTKSMTGHLLGGAGGVEGVYTALTIHTGIIPPTINYEEPDPECDLDYVPNKSRKADVKVALSNSFGFGGTNATIVLRKWDS